MKRAYTYRLLNLNGATFFAVFNFPHPETTKSKRSNKSDRDVKRQLLPLFTGWLPYLEPTVFPQLVSVKLCLRVLYFVWRVLSDLNYFLI